MQLQLDISDGEKDYARAEPPWIVRAPSPGAQMMNHCLPFVLSLTGARSEKVAPTIIWMKLQKIRYWRTASFATATSSSQMLIGKATPWPGNGFLITYFFGTHGADKKWCSWRLHAKWFPAIITLLIRRVSLHAKWWLCLGNARCGVTRAECYLTRRSFGNRIAENKYIHMLGCITNIIRILRKVACAILAAWALLHMLQLANLCFTSVNKQRACSVCSVSTNMAVPE
jgi:hypothetical protein